MKLKVGDKVCSIFNGYNGTIYEVMRAPYIFCEQELFDIKLVQAKDVFARVGLGAVYPAQVTCYYRLVIPCKKPHPLTNIFKD